MLSLNKSILSMMLLLHPTFLKVLFSVNLLGTLYGYEWYRQQLVDTWTNNSPWLIPFVPDSPTASLFFVIALLILITEQNRMHRNINYKRTNISAISLRSIIEALAVVTLVKYGGWAVIIIFWGAKQGDPIIWQEWMLVISHSFMAIQGLIYMKFLSLRFLPVTLAALWTFMNDYIDYSFHVFPYLPRSLYDQLSNVQTLTISLSLLGIFCGYLGIILAKKNV
jgi:uncharacterized membrane protein YpjA